MSAKLLKDKMLGLLFFAKSCPQPPCLTRFEPMCFYTPRKIIGMTITGASINAKLLSLIKPEVAPCLHDLHMSFCVQVIVEEAGEVLEPQILAAPWPKTSHGHAWRMLCRS